MYSYRELDRSHSKLQNTYGNLVAVLIREQTDRSLCVSATSLYVYELRDLM